MTKSTITRERLQQIIRVIDGEAYDEEEIREWLSSDEIMELSRMALAAMDSEPVAEVCEDYAIRYISSGPAPKEGLHPGDKLYRHAQQPVVPDYPETLPCPVLLEPGLRFGKGVKTRLVLDAIQRRAEHSAELEAMTPEERAEYDAGIEEFKAMLPQPAQPAPVVPDESYQQLSDLYHAQEKRLFKIAQRIKGSAFDKYSHSPSQAIDVLEAAIFGDNDACRAAMLQAQSEDDDGEPTDDERIMAIEGIHNCERCGDEGWIVGEMGITSCACGQAGTLINEGTIQAGNSPVITGAEQRIADAVELLQKAAPAMLADNSGPDGPLAGRLKSPVIPEGYVIVPKEPTDEMIAAAMNCEDVLFNSDESFCVQFGNIYEAMLAAAPQEVKGE